MSYGVQIYFKGGWVVLCKSVFAICNQCAGVHQGAVLAPIGLCALQLGRNITFLPRIQRAMKIKHIPICLFPPFWKDQEYLFMCLKRIS